MSTLLPLIAIVGQTASGKSALAMSLARQYNGEIICADSRTIYRGLNILTAKPSAQDQAEIPHHLVDIVSPDETFTAYEFKKAALQAIYTVQEKKKLPILVGGSGLYIDAVLFNFIFASKSQPKLRSELALLPPDQLIKRLKQYLGFEQVDMKNKRHIIRFIETGGTPDQARILRPNTLVVGLERDRQELRTRIEKRIEIMFRKGLRKEIKQFIEQHGWNSNAISGTVENIFQSYYRGEISTSQLKRQMVQKDLLLAKRQKTWFKRNPYIHWHISEDKALQDITSFIQAYPKG